MQWCFLLPIQPLHYANRCPTIASPQLLLDIPPERPESYPDWLEVLKRIADLGLGLLAPNGDAEQFCDQVCQLRAEVIPTTVNRMSEQLSNAFYPRARRATH